MRSLSIFVSALLLSVITAAQTPGKLSGYVTQAGRPVPAATVSVTVHDPSGNKTFNAVTDINGYYRFDSLMPGNYMVIAEGERGKGIAYRDQIAIAPAGSVQLDLDLTMEDYKVFESSLRFREIVSISADQPQPIDEVSKTVNSIEAQELRDRADFTLVDTLRSMPGFRVQQLGGFGKTASIKTRGLRNQDTAILIDGIRFRDASAITGDATPFLSDLTLTSVSKIEVLRGSGSSLYGTNAIGGVVDLQTPRPPAGFHGQISGAVGGLGLGRFRGNISDSVLNGKFGFNAGISRTVYSKGVDGNDDANNTNFQGRLNFQPTAKTDLSVRFFVSDAFVRLNSSPDTLGPVTFDNFGIVDAIEGVNFASDPDDPDDTQRSKFFDGQFSVSHVISSRVVFNGYYSGVRTRRRNETGPLGAGFQSASTSIFGGTIHTADGHVNWTPNSINEVTAGYEFEYEEFGNDGLTPGGTGNFATRASQSSNAFYAQDLVSLLKGRLQIAGGVRAQFFRLSQPGFSLTNAPYSDLTLARPPTALTFDGAASYFFDRTGTKLRVHVGNGYRVPSLFERFGTFFDNFSVPNRFVALGDPGLKPEKTIAVDGGVEQSLAKERVRLTAAYFYTKLLDTIGFGNIVRPIGNTERPFGGYQNQKGGIARGVELSGRIRPTRSADIFASYTFTNSDQREPQVLGSGVIDTLGIPKHQFTLVATQRIRRFWINADLLAASDYLAPVFSSTTFNSYVYRFQGNRRIDMTAGYNFGWKQDKLNMRLFTTVENILNEKYFENGFRTAGTTARVGASFAF